MKKIEKFSDFTPLTFDDMVNRLIANATAGLVKGLIDQLNQSGRLGDITLTPLQFRALLDSIIDIINSYIPDEVEHRTEDESNGCNLADC